MLPYIYSEAVNQFNTQRFWDPSLLINLTADPAYNSAKKALTLLLVPPKPVGGDEDAPSRAVDFFDQSEIYPGMLANRDLRRKALGSTSNL